MAGAQENWRNTMLTRISLATALALGMMAAPAMANEMNKSSESGLMNQSQSGTTGQGGSMQSGSSGSSMQSADLLNRFSEFDTDGDGAISEQEWNARQSELPPDAPSFSELNSESDPGGEQKVTRQEWDEHFGSQSSTTGAGGSMQQDKQQ